MTIRKRKWGPGPWQDEPDQQQWSYQGLPCRVERCALAGHLLGFVGVPPGHAWYGASHVELQRWVRTHGRVTFASRLPIRPSLWWVGFHCGHPGMDLIPALKHEPQTQVYLTYRDVGYVVREVQELAEQALSAAGRER